MAFGGITSHLFHPKIRVGMSIMTLRTAASFSRALSLSKYSNVEPRYNNFAPRLGFAYMLTEKTVIRGGLGRSYFINGFDAAFNHLLDSSYPVAQAQAVEQSNLYTPIFPMNVDLRHRKLHFSLVGNHTCRSSTCKRFCPEAWYPERKTSSVDSWNLSIQRQLGADTTLTVAYVGNKGNNLDYSFYNIDAAPPGPGDLLTRRPLYIKFGFTGQMYLNCTCDDSNYNALQITGVKRFTKNYSFHSAFTYAKALDVRLEHAVRREEIYDLKGSYGVSYLNQAVVWTTTHSILIPFGKGQRFGSNANPITQNLFGGWTFDGITTLQSGLALAPTDSDSSTLNADFSQRPDRIPNVPLPKRKGPSSLAAIFSVRRPRLLRMGECKSGSGAGQPITT